MTSVYCNMALTPAENSDSLGADNLFWLSKLAGEAPETCVLPDYKRSAGHGGSYESVSFGLDAHVVHVLKSLDRTRGISDFVLCTTLVVALLSKYQRDDTVIVGLQSPSQSPNGSKVVPIRVLCRDALTVLDLLCAVDTEIADAFVRSDFALGQIAEILGIEVSHDRCPFFDIALAVSDDEGTIDFEAYPVDMTFFFRAGGGRIGGTIAFRPSLFARATVERLAGHLVNVAENMALRPSRRIDEVDILSAEERRLLLIDFNARRASFPIDRTLHGLFEDQVARTPHAVAAVYGDDTLTYAELNERSNKVAHLLLALGLGEGDFVGLLMNRSCDFLVGMLAAFKSGAAYVPLDPTYPRERIAYMLKDSEAAYLISTNDILDRFADDIGSAPWIRVVLLVDAEADGMLRAQPTSSFSVVGANEIGAAIATNPGLPVTAGSRAYMIYTSGSTGHPKGAICRHNGAINHLYGEIAGIAAPIPFSFLQSAASSSDISVWQFLAPLLFGGSTVIVDYDVVVDPAQLFEALRRNRVTVAELVPVVLRALMDHVGTLPAADRQLLDLRCMMSTGEALPAELVDCWLDLYPGIPVANTYGPTETSDDVTLLVLREPLAGQKAIVPIGPPMPNISLFVLDRNLRPVPMGVPGEICVAGVAVGEGYWKQPDKTAAAFVAPPFPEAGDGPMYRTGDLGRWLSDGSIEFLGRIDQQVKIRGFRVEPGEIEAIITQHPAIQDAAVVASDDGRGNNRLIGFFVPAKDAQVRAEDIRDFIKDRVADYMIPAALTPLSALPLTPMGKVDRKALTKMQSTAVTFTETFVAPRTELERTIAAAWSTVLQRTPISVADNFFEIGGDSMLTIHVVSELRRSGVPIAPKHVFLHPTIADLAAHIAGARPKEPTMGAAAAADEARESLALVRDQLVASIPDLQDCYTLVPVQSGIYFQSILAQCSSGIYVEQICLDLKGDLDLEVLSGAWQYVVASNDTLRTSFVRRAVPQPLQVVHGEASLVPSVIDWRVIPPARQAEALDHYLTEDRRRGFDLRSAPLMRVTLLRRGDRTWTMVWTYHHMILDGWSEPLVLKDVFRAYDAIIDGTAPSPILRLAYGDFVSWLQRQDTTKAERYWRQLLSGFDAPVSIVDTSASVDPPSNVELSHGWCDIALSETESSMVEHASRTNRLTLSTVIHGAWAMLLHRRTGAADVVFGSAVSGRQADLSGIETVRGLVIATLPLRTRVVADASAAAWLRLLQLQTAENREFEHTALGTIQTWSEVPQSKRPLFSSIVVMASYPDSELTALAPAGLVISGVRYLTQPHYPLSLFVVPGVTTNLRLIYDKRHFAAETVRTLLSEYRDLLMRIAERPDQRLESLVRASSL